MGYAYPGSIRASPWSGLEYLLASLGCQEHQDYAPQLSLDLALLAQRRMLGVCMVSIWCPEMAEMKVK